MPAAAWSTSKRRARDSSSMKRRTKWILAACVVAVAVGTAAVGALALLVRSPSGTGGLWGGDSYLDVRLEGELPEAPSQDLGSLLERRPTSLRTLVDSF